MADIRKRVGKKGTTYQVRYPSKSTQSGYAFETFRTMKEARDFSQNLGSIREPVSTEFRTVEQGLKKWLNVCKTEGRHGRDPVTPYTLKSYEYRSAIACQYDWQKELQELAGPDIVEFRSWLIDNYSRDQARKVLSSFHSMILEMVSRGILDHDVVTGVSISSSSRYDELVQIPRVKDIHALLSAADRLANSKNAQIQKTWERYRPMLYLAADSGMRPQEYVAVPRNNIKETGVKVDRALERGGYKISVTKTPAGRRFIDLSPDTVDMVRHYADHHAVSSKYDLVFPTSTGHWQSTDNWRKRGFYKACYEAGLIEKRVVDGKVVEKPKYKPYDLRHFYASILIDQRTNLKRIQRLMGHEDIQTTLNVYGHLIERAEDADIKHTGMLATLN